MKLIAKIVGGIGILIVIVLAGQVGKEVGRSAGESMMGKSGQKIPDKYLAQAADALNKNLPMMVDADTRLESTMGFNQRLQYKYTLVKYPSNSISPPQLISAMRQKVKNQVCSNADMKPLVEGGITMVYSYFGNDGRHIASIEIPSSECSRR